MALNHSNVRQRAKGLYAATHRFFACESYETTIAQMNSWRNVKTDEQGGTNQRSKLLLTNLKLQNY